MPSRTVPNARFLVSAFAVHLCERDPEGFAYLTTLAKGQMLSNVLYLPDIGNVGQRFRHLTVYFDTPFLLRALGLAGPSLQAPYRELLDMLYRLGAQLACFDHRYKEVTGILEGARNTIRMGSRDIGETARFLLDTLGAARVTSKPQSRR